jgi:ABC-type multidrug transport system fused ATPase/permease subunit
MTIFENISLGMAENDVKRGGDDYVRNRVIEAAKLAEAHDFIMNKCESGYDTPIRQISRLSGGQRQRIALARALVSNAQILICDEITASLDAETEKKVLGTLFRAMRDKALLVIAHRLSTIRHADEIVFMEDGKIIERGSHDELLRLNGRYCDYLRNDQQHSHDG